MLKLTTDELASVWALKERLGLHPADDLTISRNRKGHVVVHVDSLDTIYNVTVYEAFHAV